MKFENQTVVVSGASQGMGYACAKLFAEQGARVIGLARNLERLESAFTQLTNPSWHKSWSVDFSDIDQVQDIASQLVEFQPSILINNAGGPAPSTAMKASPEDYLQAFTQHLLASSILSQALIPSMIEHQYGRIVNIVSVSAKQASDNLATSNTVRAAMLNWSKTLSNEVAASGVTVNNVLPGYTETERLLEVISARALIASSSDDAIRDKLLSKIPMRRFAKAEEIAEAVVFLASPQAAYITGVSIPVDGGYLAGV